MAIDSNRVIQVFRGSKVTDDRMAFRNAAILIDDEGFGKC